MEVGALSPLALRLKRIEDNYLQFDAVILKRARDSLVRTLDRAQKDLEKWDQDPSSIAVVWGLTAVDKSYLRETIARLTSLVQRLNARLNQLKKLEAV